MCDNINLKDWCNKLEVMRDDLEYMFTSDFISTVIKIIERSDDKPIKSFSQKSNKLYVFNENNWELCSINMFTDIVFKIQKQLLNYFSDWVKELGDKLYYDSNNSLYMKYSSKILGNGNMDEKILKIYNKLYSNLKMNVRDMVEYQITF